MRIIRIRCACAWRTRVTCPPKDVVQVYVNTPYGEYEKQRNIEKPAILFVGFEKTGVVEPARPMP